MTRRSRIPAVLAAAVLAVFAVLAAGPARAAPAAVQEHAAPAVSHALRVPGVIGYHFSMAYGYTSTGSSEAQISEHTTNTGTQIWINDVPHCVAFGGGIITWCGYLGNGTGILDTGFNYVKVEHGKNVKYWLRLDLYATARPQCTVRGNFTTMAIDNCLS